MGRYEKINLAASEDIIEMIHNSRAGHVGGDLSVVDILATLYFQVMNVSPENFTDPDRDRFLLSKGHCADALYCVLGERGFFDKQEAIQTFSHFGSRFIGHPNTDSEIARLIPVHWDMAFRWAWAWRWRCEAMEVRPECMWWLETGKWQKAPIMKA